jgi:superfamily II DNA or RNA helicase/HKD family nuclease
MTVWRRPALVPGIYDEVVTARVRALLAALPQALQAEEDPLPDRSDVATAVGTLLRDALDAALDDASDDRDRILSMANELLTLLDRHAPGSFAKPHDWTLSTSRLRAVVERPASGYARPLGSLHRSSLIANAEGDRLIDHLRSEFDSADRIDLLCAFVKLSGVEKLRTVLERHCELRGRPLRVLTTTYMGASDVKAIERLASLRNTIVKVSYDVEVTRLHAKAWLFNRNSGMSTAYVGSSNLSHAAQTDGLEWNVRIAESEQPALVEQFRETFEQYWDDARSFEAFDLREPAQRARLARALSPVSRDDGDSGVLIELEPKAYQKPILEELAAARRLGRHRNLIVAATGTGKTVMAALDYTALRAEGRVDSLLFVAHRREILEQSRSVFRAALQLRDFGEMLHQFEKPTVGRHVFASIDSLGAGASVDPTRFDMVIFDEVHHAGADTWDALLAKLAPRELLGLTGTPERADGIDYEHHFPRPWVGNLRVWNAIPDALVPFRYYMLDVGGVDLRDVSWSRAGRYVGTELSGKLVDAADIFVERAMRALRDHVGRPEELRAIAFCVDRRHAESIAERFTRNGYKTQVLTEDTGRDERRRARHDLDGGRVQILCVVDLYNEGVDVPNVNTLFFFRPTESATVFLQQLGRGLRRTRTKSELVVFDLTGRHRLEFRFDRRLRALLGHTPRELKELVERGTGRLPSGCHLQFDEVAREEVLAQLQRAVPVDVRGIRALLREPVHATLPLDAFLRETEVELPDLYAKGRSWSLLRREVGLDVGRLDETEAAALANVHKLIFVGDDVRLASWERFARLEPPTDELGRRLLAMLFVVLYGKELAIGPPTWELWASHAGLRAELTVLATVLATRNAILVEPHELDATIPLRLHASYLGAELSAAFGERTARGHLRDYYTGVERAAGGRYDLLFVTLQKAAAKKEHLKYRDFPLNEQRFHWQSKARTTRDSREGRRHLDPAGEGCTPLLFVRVAEDDRPGVTAPFQYLGPVTPDGAEGERPISIEWKLAFAMPTSLVRRGRVAA